MHKTDPKNRVASLKPTVKPKLAAPNPLVRQGSALNGVKAKESNVRASIGNAIKEMVVKP